MKQLISIYHKTKALFCWYYRKGKLISRYELVIQNGL